MDRASQALAQRLPPDVPRTYTALAERSNVPFSTFHYCDQWQHLKEELAQSQQYIPLEEKKAIVKVLLLMFNLRHLVQIKFIHSLAFSIARHWSTDKPIKPLGKNWPQAFKKRHDSHIYDKVTEWFEVVGKVLQDLAILPENCYNMDETRVLLRMLGFVEVYVGKDDIWDYKGAGIKRTMVIAIECVSADNRPLLPLIIWPASTNWSNWTAYLTLGWHYGHFENGYNQRWQ